MGYTGSGGPKGLGVFTNAAQTVSDLNQLVALIARGGNLRVETTAGRDAITGAALYEGLHVYNTTLDQLEMYTGSGWAVVWHDWKTYTPTTTNISGGTIAAKYKRDGNVIRVQLRHSLAGANFTGQPAYSLPVPAADTSIEWFDGVVLLRDGTPATEYFGIARKASQTSVAPYALAASTAFTQFSNVDDDSPFVWAAGDLVDMKFTYEV